MYNTTTWRIRAAELNNKFDYSNTIYNGSHNPATAVCKKCGKENTKPATQFIKGIGCDYCNGNHNYSNEEYLTLAKEKFPNFDFSKTNYINRRTKIIAVCDKGHEFTKLPLKVLESGCPICYRKTEEEWRKYVEELYGDKYDYSISHYKNAKTPVNFKCKKCGRIITKMPRQIVAGEGCRYCEGIIFNQETFINRAKELFPNFDFSKTIYKGREYNFTAICDKGHEFTKQAVKLETGCPICKKLQPDTEEDFLRKNPHNETLDVIFLEGNNLSKIGIICEYCGNISSIAKHNFLSGEGCKFCSFKISALKKIVPQEEILKRFRKVHGDYYDYSRVNYLGKSKMIEIGCPKCGRWFWKFPMSHINGYGCSFCNSSVGERRIVKWLDEHNIKFSQQIKFEDLRDLNPLSYDFLIGENILLEYNGEQHYKYSKFFYKNLHDFHRQLHHDWMKRNYAKKHNYNLITIPYWKLNSVEEILEEICLKN